MKMSLCARYARYTSRGGCGRAPNSNITGVRRRAEMARETDRRSSASSPSVELTKTRRRWSGVRMTTSSGGAELTDRLRCACYSSAMSSLNRNRSNSSCARGIVRLSIVCTSTASDDPLLGIRARQLSLDDVEPLAMRLEQTRSELVVEEQVAPPVGERF